MSELKICAVQLDIKWEDYNQNLDRIKHFVEEHASHSDLIIFPEMFLTGFSMNTSIAIEQSHEYVQQIIELSKLNTVSIAGSLMIKENDAFFNRFIYIKPTGELCTYDKRHLFRMANEHLIYTAGRKKIITEEQTFKISPFICYDLRFPVWMRNINNEYDVCLVVANWPHARIDAWLTLLKARAIENQSYIVGVNRVGTDGNQIAYSGGTTIFDFKGNIITQAKNNTEECICATLTLDELRQFRQSFPAYADADSFHILL